MITDVGGIRIGHATNEDAITGCTVMICDVPMLAGVDIRGSNTATRDTPRLRPVSITQQVHGILLTGGSGFGLNAITGLAQYLEETGNGMKLEGGIVIPVVTGAVLYDLDIGSSKIRPDAEMGYQACLNATSGEFARGNVGAGMGATVGKFYGISRCTKGGLGTYTERIANGIIVSALVVVNAFGDIVDPLSNTTIAGLRDSENKTYVRTMELIKKGEQSTYWSSEKSNTTLGIIATNAQLSNEAATKIAEMAHDGFARTINPVHTLFDGDIIYAVGRMKSDFSADTSVLGSVAAEVMSKAIIDAVKNANSLEGGIKCCTDW